MASNSGVYDVKVNGNAYRVEISAAGEMAATPKPPPASGAQAGNETAKGLEPGAPLPSPLAGNVFKILVSPGQQVGEGETVIVLEAMKMETEISAPAAGTVSSIDVIIGDSVAVGDSLIKLA